MRTLNAKVGRRAPNAHGRDTYSEHQDFEIEASDVNRERQNYLGNGHSSYKFNRSDVGKVITVYTDRTSWTCWVFKQEGCHEAKT